MWQIAANLPVPRYVVADEGRMLPETVPISLTLEERKGAFINMCQKKHHSKVTRPHASGHDHMPGHQLNCVTSKHSKTIRQMELIIPPKEIKHSHVEGRQAVMCFLCML